MRILTQLFAYLYDGVECFDRKVHAHVHVPEVGQLNACSFVHSGELQFGVSLDPVLIQRRPGPGEPWIPVRPPQSMIRPIHGDICERKKKCSLVSF